MPLFASYQMDNGLLSFVLFFSLKQNFCPAHPPGFVCILLVVFPPVLKRVGVAMCACLWSLKPNHRLQILSYGLTTSASAQKLRLDLYLSS